MTIYINIFKNLGIFFIFRLASLNVLYCGLFKMTPKGKFCLVCNL